MRGEGSGEDDRLDIVYARATWNCAIEYHFILPVLTAVRLRCRRAPVVCFTPFPASPRIVLLFVRKLFGQKVGQYIPQVFGMNNITLQYVNTVQTKSKRLYNGIFSIRGLDSKCLLWQGDLMELDSARMLAGFVHHFYPTQIPIGKYPP